jgi:hypothetical protein
MKPTSKSKESGIISIVQSICSKEKDVCKTYIFIHGGDPSGHGGFLWKCNRIGGKERHNETGLPIAVLFVRKWNQ